MGNLHTLKHLTPGAAGGGGGPTPEYSYLTLRLFWMKQLPQISDEMYLGKNTVGCLVALESPLNLKKGTSNFRNLIE